MRSWNVGRNALIGLFCQISTILLSFLARTVFVHILTNEYLGITTLFTSILAILNLSELGLSSAITFALYKPLAQRDNDSIRAIMQFYRRAYQVVGFVFLLLGLALIPFLPNLLTGNTTLVNIYAIYALYLIQTVLSYWFFAYKAVLLTADQKEHLISLIMWGCKTFSVLMQIMFLYLLRDTPAIAFYAFIIITVTTTLLTNAFTAYIVNKLYPFLQDKTPSKITKEERTRILKNIFGLAIYRISGTVNYHLDSIIISAYVSLSVVGIYSNYVLITSGVTQLLGSIFTPFKATIGNLNASESAERSEFILYCLHLLYFWICGLAGVCMWVLYTPFIGGIWLTSDWSFPQYILIALVLKFWIDALNGAIISYREASGLFWATRYRYLITPIINICISLYLVQFYDLGILGILTGSIVSELFNFIIDPIIVFQHTFQKRPWKYYFRYIKYLCLAIGTAHLVQTITLLWNTSSMLGFSVALAVCLILPNILWTAIFYRTPEFQYLWHTMSNIVSTKILTKIKHK